VKLIIQIPCFNEEGQLPLTLSHIPRRVPGFDVVEWLIIDDGSTDRTVEVAGSMGSITSSGSPTTRGWPPPSRPGSTPG